MGLYVLIPGIVSLVMVLLKKAKKPKETLIVGILFTLAGVVMMLL